MFGQIHQDEATLLGKVSELTMGTPATKEFDPAVEPPPADCVDGGQFDDCQ